MTYAVVFTKAELSAIDTALFDYQMETEGYLRGYLRAESHDPRCETYKARQAYRDIERASLEARLSTIKSALERIPV